MGTGPESVTCHSLSSERRLSLHRRLCAVYVLWCIFHGELLESRQCRTSLLVAREAELPKKASADYGLLVADCWILTVTGGAGC